MRNPWLAAALALPILFLALTIGRQQAGLASAHEWRIPVSGYDPRDLLRGHYIRFSYDWTLQGDPAPCFGESGCSLCLAHDDGTVVARVIDEGAACAARVDTARSGIDVRPGFRQDPATFTSRIFVSETSAPALEAQLREGPMLVVAMLDSDGRLINRKLEPR